MTGQEILDVKSDSNLKSMVVPAFTTRAFQFLMDPCKGELSLSWSLWPAILHDICTCLPWHVLACLHSLQQGWALRMGQHLCPGVPESYIEHEVGNYLPMNYETGTKSVIRQRDSRKRQIQFPHVYAKALSIKNYCSGRENSGTSSRKCSLGDPRETMFKLETMVCGKDDSLPLPQLSV